MRKTAAAKTPARKPAKKAVETKPELTRNEQADLNRKNLVGTRELLPMTEGAATLPMAGQPPVPARTARTRVDKPNAANTPKHAVEQTEPGQFVAVIGPYGTEVEAKSEATQYLHPRVFFYRAAIFPNPRNYGVGVQITTATAVPIKNSNPLMPWGVKLDIHVTGSVPSKVQGWITSFKGRTKFFDVRMAP